MALEPSPPNRPLPAQEPDAYPCLHPARGRRRMLLGALGALAFVASGAPAQAPGRARITAVVDSLAERGLASGQLAGMSVAVVRGRDTLLLKAYGRASVELDVPTPEHAVYEIASEAKPFTAAAILQLAEQGRLSLDDPLAKHLPGVLSDDISGRVTLRQMLTHTSGIRDYPNIREFHPVSTQSLPRDTLLKLIAAEPLDFEPGTAQFYSNSGFLLLGLVVERLSGMTWEEYVERELFARAGMAHSRASRGVEIVPGMASGYTYDREKGLLQRAPHLEPEWIHGNGGLRSTAGDMAAWMTALHGGRILGPAAYREMITPGVLADGTRLRYGSGMTMDSLQGHFAYFHGGSYPGYQSLAVHLPDDTATVVVLMNSGRGVVDEWIVADRVIAELLGTGARRPGPFRGQTAEYAGEYRSGVPHFDYSVAIAADSTGALTMSLDGARPFPLVHRGGDAFSSPSGSLRFTFIRRGGAVIGARFDWRTFNIPFERQPAASTP